MQPVISINPPQAAKGPGVEALGQGKNSMANEMKTIRKGRLQRLAMQDPSLHRKLVAVEASPLYNASGELIPALTSQSIEV